MFCCCSLLRRKARVDIIQERFSSLPDFIKKDFSLYMIMMNHNVAWLDTASKVSRVMASNKELFPLDPDLVCRRSKGMGYVQENEEEEQMYRHTIFFHKLMTFVPETMEKILTDKGLRLSY